MKKLFRFAVFMAVFMWIGIGYCFAGEIDTLVNKLIEKGVLTPGEAQQIITETKEEVKKETSSNYYLDIIAKENAESLSISGYSFDYSYLGNRKQYNIFANFSNLVKDTAGFLPNAVRNRGVRSLEQGGGTFRDFRYRSIEEYEAEKLWLLQLLKK